MFENLKKAVEELEIHSDGESIEKALVLRERLADGIREAAENLDDDSRSEFERATGWRVR